MVQKLIFIALFLLGSVVGWLVVYFVRKYKEHSPKALRDTIVLFLGGGCMDLLLSLIDKQTALYAFAAYLIGFGVAFFLHWIYQFVVAKLTAPKYLDPRSKYDLFSGCSLPEAEQKARIMECYQLEIVNQGFEQLCGNLISAKEFALLVRKSGLTPQSFEKLTSSPVGDMLLSPAIVAYIRAKNIWQTNDNDAPVDK